MKFALLISLILNSVQIIAQSNGLACDSIKLKNGKVLELRIIKKKKRKLIYSECLKSVSKTKRIKRKYIDSVYYMNGTNSFNRRDSIPFIQLISWYSDGLSIKNIKENSKLVIRTKDSIKLRGRLVILNKDTIFLRFKSDPNISPQMNGKTDWVVSKKLIPISNISSLKTTGKSVRITGNLIGGIISLFGLYRYYSSGQYISIFYSTPFYALNFRKKNYDLSTKWKAEIRFKKID